MFTLSHSESSESSGVFSVFFAPICISGREQLFAPIRAFIGGEPSVLFEVICIESIFALYLSSVGLVELLLLALHPSEPDVLRSISTFWAHHSFAGERIIKLYTSSFSFHHHRHCHLPHSYNITLRHNRAKWWLMSKFSVNNWSIIYSLQHGPYTLFSNCAWGRHSYWSITLWLLLLYCLSYLTLHSCRLRTHCDQLGARQLNSKCQQLWGNLFVRLLIHFFVVVDLIQLHWSEIKGVRYWIWGWLVRVMGFRTGVWNFVGAGLGFWESTFVFLDLGLLWGKFLVFWGALVGHSLVCMVLGGDHFFFLLSFLSFFLFFSLGVSSLRGCAEIS